MRRNLILGMLFALCVGVAAAQQAPAPAGGGQQGAAQGGRGRGQGGGAGQGARGGGGGGAAVTNPADTYGTADTLFTMPEAGQGGDGLRIQHENEKASRLRGGLIINRATSYSPTHLRVQYHRG